MEKIKDLVCGRDLEENNVHAKVTHGHTHFVFCSKQCKEEFENNPDKFITGEPVLELRNIQKKFKLGEVDVPVLHDLSLRIWQGDFVAIMGASGSGKSTAMNILGCLDTPTHGKVFIDGIDTSHMSDRRLAEVRSRKIGFVFQQYNLLSALTCLENVTLPAFFTKNFDSEKTEKRAKELLNTVQLEGRTGHRPLEMSGGEQQRTAIARSLINDPEIILGDEPTGNLDSKTGKIIMEILKELNERGKTLVLITHDPSIAKVAKKIFHIKDGALIDNSNE